MDPTCAGVALAARSARVNRPNVRAPDSGHACVRRRILLLGPEGVVRRARHVFCAVHRLIPSVRRGVRSPGGAESRCWMAMGGRGTFSAVFASLRTPPGSQPRSAKPGRPAVPGLSRAGTPRARRLLGDSHQLLLAERLSAAGGRRTQREVFAADLTSDPSALRLSACVLRFGLLPSARRG